MQAADTAPPALHLAARRGCEVVGVTLEPNGVAAARRRAELEGLSDAVDFHQADIQFMEIEQNRFDTVLLECVLSTLDRKRETLDRLHDGLPAGGRIALSDVTVEGTLPLELQGTVSSALCIGDALSHEEYIDLLMGTGFEVLAADDVKDVALEFVQRIRTALMMAEAAVGLGKLDASRESIREVRGHVRTAQAAIEEGLLSYSIFVARKT